MARSPCQDNPQLCRFKNRELLSVPCPLQAPLDSSELLVLDMFICCRAWSKKPPNQDCSQGHSSKRLCSPEAPHIWLTLLQGANSASKESQACGMCTPAVPGRQDMGWTKKPCLGQGGQEEVEALLGYTGSLWLKQMIPQHQALTALIFFHCRSSSALSFVSLKRRVLRPSDILIPYWKAALGKEGDRAQQLLGKCLP